MNPNFIWGGLLLIGAGYEAYAIRNAIKGDTLSERTRQWFNTGTPWGRVVFSAGWISFAAWFLWHILKG